MEEQEKKALIASAEKHKDKIKGMYKEYLEREPHRFEEFLQELNKQIDDVGEERVREFAGDEITDIVIKLYRN